jgi:hypothetical protein
MISYKRIARYRSRGWSFAMPNFITIPFGKPIKVMICCKSFYTNLDFLSGFLVAAIVIGALLFPLCIWYIMDSSELSQYVYFAIAFLIIMTVLILSLIFGTRVIQTFKMFAEELGQHQPFLLKVTSPSSLSSS